MSKERVLKIINTINHLRLFDYNPKYPNVLHASDIIKKHDKEKQANIDLCKLFNFTGLEYVVAYPTPSKGEIFINRDNNVYALVKESYPDKNAYVLLIDERYIKLSLSDIISNFKLANYIERRSI